MLWSFPRWEAGTKEIIALTPFYTHDLEEGIMCDISKFVNETMLGGSHSCEEDSERLKIDELNESVKI